MNQFAFEKACGPDWEKFDQLVDAVNRKDASLETNATYDLPNLYLQICTHYSIAKERSYSPKLVSMLHDKVHRGHLLLYKSKGRVWWRAIEFILSRFPYQVRRHYKHFWLAAGMFYIPAILMGIACYLNGELIYSIMPEHMVQNMEDMYDPSSRVLGRTPDRESDTDFMMFGHYIMNNVSIGFRCFAMGILLGIGTIVMLLYNGIAIGGVAGYLTQLGFIDTFWPFVSGHGSFELTAIVICGAAGLRLAEPIIAPGRLSRAEALIVAGRDSVELVLGAAIMLVVAAFIEAFWSSSTYVNIELKYAVALFLWILVLSYLIWAGKKDFAD